MKRVIAFAALALGLAGYGGYEALEAPGNQLFGKTVVRGATTRAEVALTFDDGPNPPYTERILDVLQHERIPATFFVVGRAAAAYPQTIRRIVRDGHTLGNHTWDHPHLIVQSRAAMRAEMSRTDAILAKITGRHTRLMRPPFGARDFAVMGEMRKLGYRVVMWSVPLPRDWEQPGDETIARRVTENISDGSIIVLHDGDRGRICARERVVSPHACDRSQDVAATRKIVDVLRARGFRFVSIPTLIADAESHGSLARR